MSQHNTLTRALQEIADWNSHTTEFAVDYGSNGVRDFYRGIARAALSATQPAQAAPRLIGWRTSDYLMETSDKAKADNWSVHHEILPIFEGDPHTKLQSSAANPAQAAQGDPLRNVPDAMNTVIEALRSDPDYAWSWHCNVAMASFDEGMGHYEANQAAARFMHSLAGVDTTKHKGFPSEPDQQPAPAQGAGEVAADEFFAYHPEMGVEFFKTQREAVACTRENLDYEREGAIDQGEWDDSAAERTCWGVVVQRAKAVQSGMSDEGVAQFDYVLADTQPADGADVPDMVEIMALADSYRNATCPEATANAREWLRAAIAASGRQS